MSGEEQRRSIKPYLVLGLGLAMVIAGGLQIHYGGGWPGLVGIAAGAAGIAQGGYDLVKRR